MPHKGPKEQTSLKPWLNHETFEVNLGKVVSVDWLNRLAFVDWLSELCFVDWYKPVKC